jgi:hypothetical protein
MRRLTRREIWAHRRGAVPWHLPRAIYYVTPFAWVRAYARAGDWALGQFFHRSRPLVWWLADRFTEIDQAIMRDGPP